LGYQRATTDIDLLLPPTREQGERVRRALLTLPDRVILERALELVRRGGKPA
jgi:hypothetical protein